MTLLRLAGVSNYFCKIENELVVNLKPGKTESMSFATGKLSQNKKPLKLEYKFQTTVSTLLQQNINILEPSWIKHYHAGS